MKMGKIKRTRNLLELKRTVRGRVKEGMGMKRKRMKQ
jgi:hypothetical protein